MSASQDKKKRQAERLDGTERRMVAEREAAEKQRKSKIKWTVGSIIVGLLVIAILLANSNLFYSTFKSVKVGDVSYTNAEYQYFYKNSYYQFCSTYSDYLSMFGLDTQKSLSDQPCSMVENGTWADYFRQDALTAMAQTTALYKSAVDAGYTLSEEDAAAIDEQIAQLDTYASTYGYASTKKYISAAFGRGCTEATIRKIMEMSAISAAYQSDMQKSFTYTDEQLDTWYAENKDSNDVFGYIYYLVSAEKVETTTDVLDGTTGESAPQTSSAVTDETMAAAKAAADEIAAKAVNADEFKAAVAAYSEGAEVTDGTNGTGASIPVDFAAWMQDSSRAAGDVTVAESEGSGYYVVMYLSRDDNSYNTVAFRHILVNAVDEDEDGTFGDAEIEKAKTAIETVQKEWEASDKTEDTFAALAEKYSEDTGSNTNGGLYENVYKNRMVAEINDFIFNPATKSGDTRVCFNNSSYTGYHLVYFVGQGMTYQHYLADQALRGDDYSAWFTSVTEGVTAESNFIIKFAEK